MYLVYMLVFSIVFSRLSKSLRVPSDHHVELDSDQDLEAEDQ